MTTIVQTAQLKPPIATDGSSARVESSAVNTTGISAGAAASSPMAEHWWDAAACRNVPEAKDLFFSEELVDIAAAKRVCADCPVIADCLEGAIRRAEPWGVWGGQLFAKGRIVTIKRKRGRPPKHPRPEDQLPDIPVPEHLQKLIA